MTIFLTSLRNYKEQLDEALAQVNNIPKIIEKLQPEKIRGYDRLWEIIQNKENESIQGMTDLDEGIKIIENCKNILKDINQNIKETKKTLNSRIVGTLEGMARQAIAENSIPTKTYAQQSVLDQDYNELENIRSVGGFSKKRKNIKKRKTIKNRQLKRKRV